jgi:hypothetical protein
MWLAGAWWKGAARVWAAVHQTRPQNLKQSLSRGCSRTQAGIHRGESNRPWESSPHAKVPSVLHSPCAAGNPVALLLPSRQCRLGETALSPRQKIALRGGAVSSAVTCLLRAHHRTCQLCSKNRVGNSAWIEADGNQRQRRGAARWGPRNRKCEKRLHFIFSSFLR